MPSNYVTQQAKIKKEILRLQKQADALQSKRRKPALASIVQTMRDFNITVDEVAALLGSAKSGRGGRKVAKTSKTGGTRIKAPVLPKYRNEATGETWSGRGKPPRWLSAAEAEGTSRESFLIKSPAAEPAAE